MAAVHKKIVVSDGGATRFKLGTLVRDSESDPWQLTNRQDFQSKDYPDLPSVLEAYLSTVPDRDLITLAGFGIAGPIKQNVAVSGVFLAPTWFPIRGADLKARFGFDAYLGNDALVAACSYVPGACDLSNLIPLSPDANLEDGDRRIFTLGSGVGSAQALFDELTGRYIVKGGEGSHGHLAIRNEQDLALAAFLAEDERYKNTPACPDLLCSGGGLATILSFLMKATPAHQVSEGPDRHFLTALQQRSADQHPVDLILTYAFLGSPLCEQAFRLWVTYLARHAADRVLDTLARVVIIGGGMMTHLYKRSQGAKLGAKTPLTVFAQIFMEVLWDMGRDAHLMKDVSVFADPDSEGKALFGAGKWALLCDAAQAA
jgi:glucokinase